MMAAFFQSAAAREVVNASNTQKQITVNQDVLLTAKEKEWIAKHPVIRLGFNPHMEPLLIRSQNGSLSGVYPEIFSKLKAVFGLNLKIEVDDWAPTVNAVRNRSLDGLLACAPSQAEASRLLTTHPIHMAYPVVYTRNNAPFTVDNFSELKGKRIAYQRSVKMLDVALEPYKGGCDIITVKSTLEALALVLEGKIDAAVGVSFENYLIVKHALTGLKLSHIAFEYENPIATGIRNDWPEL
jgi:ABC-type amino acid transport substrate-binding protein